MKLDKWENLIIRACKKNISRDNLIRRLRKIWSMRCALDYERCQKGIYDAYIASFCAETLEKGPGYKLSDFLCDSDPDSMKLLWIKISEIELNHWEKSLYLLSIKLMLTEIKDWDGFISPLYFRNMDLTPVS